MNSSKDLLVEHIKTKKISVEFDTPYTIYLPTGVVATYKVSVEGGGGGSVENETIMSVADNQLDTISKKISFSSDSLKAGISSDGNVSMESSYEVDENTSVSTELGYDITSNSLVFSTSVEQGVSDGVTVKTTIEIRKSLDDNWSYEWEPVLVEDYSPVYVDRNVTDDWGWKFEDGLNGLATFGVEVLGTAAVVYGSEMLNVRSVIGAGLHHIVTIVSDETCADNSLMKYIRNSVREILKKLSKYNKIDISIISVSQSQIKLKNDFQEYEDVVFDYESEQKGLSPILSAVYVAHLRNVKLKMLYDNDDEKECGTPFIIIISDFMDNDNRYDGVSDSIMNDMLSRINNGSKEKIIKIILECQHPNNKEHFSEKLSGDCFYMKRDNPESVFYWLEKKCTAQLRTTAQMMRQTTLSIITSEQK